MRLSKEKEIILSDKNHNLKVIAGPGSGKTTLIVEKVKRLVDSGVDPRKILVITYTNKAALELEQRISQRIESKSVPYVSTVHGFCSRFMKENIGFFSDYKGYKVLDELGQMLFVVKYIKKIRSSELKFKAKELKDYFGRIKDNYFPEELSDWDNPLKEPYLTYNSLLKETRSFDFADLINITYKKILEDSNLGKLAKEKFEYLLIDEYQDFNRVQEALLKSFMGKKSKLMVVGDKNQSIYGFRGSDVTIFDNFDRNFSDVKTYYLKKNYRSTKKVISLSNSFFSLERKEAVKPNEDLNDGPKNLDGTLLQAVKYPDTLTEAKENVLYIKDLYDKGKLKRYSDAAIIFRSVKGGAKDYIKELKKLDMPFEVIGDGGLLEEEYIIELLNCFQQVINEQDISNDYWKIKIEHNKIKPSISKGPLQVFYSLLESSRVFLNMIKEERDDMLFNLGKLSKILHTYVTTFGNNFDNLVDGLSYLDRAFLDTEQPQKSQENSVKIITLHSSKGLEFPLVIMPRMSKEGYKFRNYDPLSEIFENYDSLKDLERAIYVGLTRAQSLVRITCAGSNQSEYFTRLITHNEKFISFSIHKQKSLSEFFSSQNQEEVVLTESEMVSNPLELTHYKLIEFDKCPFSYKLRFYYGFIMPILGPMYYGSKVHNLLYQINKIISEERVFTYDKIRNFIQKEHSPFYQEKEKEVRDYLTKFKNDIKGKIYPEKPFEFSLGNSIIAGRVDLFLKKKVGSNKVIEFKSGMSNKNKEQNVVEQLKLYALALKNENITKGVYYFFGDGKKEEIKINNKQATINFLESVDKISKSNFDPNQKSCANCIFSRFKICPNYESPKKEKTLEEFYDHELDYDLELDNNPVI